MNIKNFRIEHVSPIPFVTEELLRLYRKDHSWVNIQPLEYPRYIAEIKYPTPLRAFSKRSSDVFSLLSLSTWLGSGPKIFQPTEQQVKALEQIEVKLTVADYSQPYQAIFVMIDKPPYIGAIIHLYENQGRRMLNGIVVSHNREMDITSTILSNETEIEQSLCRFDPDCEYTEEAKLVLRTAINSCLALMQYDHVSEYLFPKDVESDQRLSQVGGEKAERAAKRVKLAVQQLSFSREIVLHRTRNVKSTKAVTGSEKGPHWRRGHWRMQACGTARAERKRILILPMFIRPDLFIGDKADTQVSYKTQ